MLGWIEGVREGIYSHTERENKVLGWIESVREGIYSHTEREILTMHLHRNSVKFEGGFLDADEMS